MTRGQRRRLDVDLVRRGLAANRQQAQAAILGGRVLVGGAVAERPSRLVGPGEPVVVHGPGPRFVGRGGEKLAAALDHFALDVAGAGALDAGASTGGFTDCLLQHGAARVVAVDVGRGQLDAGLRSDPRVVVMERTNVRYLTLEAVEAAGGKGVVPVDVVTADLSFISLAAVVPVLAGPVVRPGGHLVLLVKPQFEVGRVEVSKGRGVIRDPELWLDALAIVASSLGAAGAAIMDVMPSPLAGASGNTEFLLHATAHAVARGQPAAGEPPASVVDARLRAAVEAAATGPGRPVLRPR